MPVRIHEGAKIHSGPFSMPTRALSPFALGRGAGEEGAGLRRFWAPGHGASSQFPAQFAMARRRLQRLMYGGQRPAILIHCTPLSDGTVGGVVGNYTHRPIEQNAIGVWLAEAKICGQEPADLTAASRRESPCHVAAVRVPWPADKLQGANPALLSQRPASSREGAPRFCRCFRWVHEARRRKGRVRAMAGAMAVGLFPLRPARLDTYQIRDPHAQLVVKCAMCCPHLVCTNRHVPLGVGGGGARLGRHGQPQPADLTTARHSTPHVAWWSVLSFV